MIKESQVQTDIVKGIRLFYANELFAFAVPNGGKRNFREAVAMKRTGTVAGVSDLVVLGNNKKVFFVEVKTDKGRMSDTQIEFKMLVESKGFDYLLVRSFADFQKQYEAIVCAKNNVSNNNVIDLTK